MCEVGWPPLLELAPPRLAGLIRSPISTLSAPLRTALGAVETGR
jgi:hypothetical protein